MKIRTIIISIIVAAIGSACSVTHTIQRKQYTAKVQHTPRQVQNKIQMERDSALQAQILQDSSNTTVIRGGMMFGNSKDNWVDDGQGGQMISINIEKVSVVAKSRTLAERDGRVAIDFMIFFPKELQGESQNIVLTPFLIKGDDRIALSELQVRGGLFSKLQDRNYWLYSKYRNTLLAACHGNPSPRDSVKLQEAFERFIDHPYLTQARFDSITKGGETVSYLYKEEVKTDEDTKRIQITLQGEIQALDGSVYVMPPSDTISFNISSVLAFVDKGERYVKKIIGKYVSVQDRSLLSFATGKTNLVDTMGDNEEQLAKIGTLMSEILLQNEYHVDNITLTASSSPEGSATSNLSLSKGRAESLKKYLTAKFDFPEIDTLLKIKWIGEDWQEMSRMVENDQQLDNKRALMELIGDQQIDPDVRERRIREKFPKQYKQIMDRIYPKLRAVSFTYALRRVGMVKDTIETTELDTLYARGRDLLSKRKYQEASNILYPYRDQNSAVALLSMGMDRSAREILFELPASPIIYYLRAIVCTRLGEKRLARECYTKAIEMDEKLSYRARLDPEISSLMNLR